jgi:hypothetical protein
VRCPLEPPLLLLLLLQQQQQLLLPLLKAARCRLQHHKMTL